MNETSVRQDSSSYTFYYKKIIIFDSSDFQAIQTADLYKKNASKMCKHNLFMFLDLQGSCDQNQN